MITNSVRSDEIGGPHSTIRREITSRPRRLALPIDRERIQVGGINTAVKVGVSRNIAVAHPNVRLGCL